MTRSNPTLEIVADDRAFIVQGEKRVEMTGPVTEAIIAWYRHQQTHGEAHAATYLMGVIHGLQHAAFGDLQRLLDRITEERHPFEKGKDGM